MQMRGDCLRIPTRHQSVVITPEDIRRVNIELGMNTPSAQDVDSKLTFLHDSLQRKVEGLLKIVNEIEKHGLGGGQHPGLLDDLRWLTKELSLVDQDLSICRIGFVGPTSAGKTTLVNAIIGHKLLPEGDCSAITGSITEVVGWERHDYYGCVYFIDPDEWSEMVRLACSCVADVNADSNSARIDLARPPEVELIEDCLESLWFPSDPPRIPHKWNSDLAEALLPPKALEMLKNGFFCFMHGDLEEFKRELEKYADRSCQWWPLVHKIVVHGPFVPLREGGFAVMDIPGMDVSDPCLHQRYERGSSQCDRLFLLPEKSTVFASRMAELVGDSTFLLGGVEDLGIVVTHFATVIKSNMEHRKKVRLRRGISGTVEEHSKVEDVHLRNQDDVQFSKMRISEVLKKKFSLPLDRFALYCLENGAEDCQWMVERGYSPQMLFEDFIFGLSKQRLERLNRRMVNAFVQANNLLALQRAKIQLPQQDELEVTCRQLKGVNLGEFIPVSAPTDSEGIYKDWVQGAFNRGREIVMNLEDCHYTQLSCLLQTGKYGHFNLARMVREELFCRSSWDSLKRVTQEKLICIKEDVRKQVWKLYENMRDGTLKEGLCELLDACQQRCDILLEVPVSMGEPANAVENALMLAIRSRLEADRPTARLSRGRGYRRRLLDYASSMVREEMEKFERVGQESARKYVDDSFRDLLAALKRSCNKANDEVAALARRDAHMASIDLRNILEELRPIDHYRDEPKLPIQPLQELNLGNPNVLKSNGPVGSDGLSSVQSWSPCLRPVPIDYRFSRRNPTPGVVYVMKNPSYDNDVHKIGFTRYSSSDRAQKLFTTGVISPFIVEKEWRTGNAVGFENLMHFIFANVRIRKNREFFQAPIQLIVRVGDAVGTRIDSSH